jgi:hypothetical protein
MRGVEMQTSTQTQRIKIVDDIITGLEASLPATFIRTAIPGYTGKLLSVGYLANLGDAGSPYIRDRRHAVYEKQSFLDWLRIRLTENTRLNRNEKD